MTPDTWPDLLAEYRGSHLRERLRTVTAGTGKACPSRATTDAVSAVRFPFHRCPCALHPGLARPGRESN
jgi:hypothetical protein